MESIHDANFTSFHDESKGRPLRFSAEWSYDGKTWIDVN